MAKILHPIVLQDTREQLPYGMPDGWTVIKTALPTGDYSILGHEHCFAVERKSESDLLGCLFDDRFTRELERLSRFQRAFLVIESNWYQMKRNPRYRGNWASVFGKLQSIGLRYGVHVMFLDNRETAQAYTQGLLAKYYKMAAEGAIGPVLIPNDERTA